MNPDFSEGAEFYEKHLRTFPASPAMPEPSDVPLFGSLPDLLESFCSTTGFQLAFVRSGGTVPTENVVAQIPVEGDSSKMAGRLIVSRRKGENPRVESTTAVRLAESISATLGEAYRWSFTLRRREAELASLGHYSMIPTEETKDHPAQKISAVLKLACRTVGCEAAALYLLDSGTTVLKLRSLWGLPEERLTDPPRPLSAAMADLEALLGNAVVLNENYLQEEWNAPECFATSLCVPVASETSILGTLWFFSDRKRDFSRRELSALEIVAGRIASELERSALLIENRRFRLLSRQVETMLEHLTEESSPMIESPEGWRFASRADLTDCVPKTFCQWTDLTNDRAALAVGGVKSDGGDGSPSDALLEGVQTARFFSAIRAAAESSAVGGLKKWTLRRGSPSDEADTQRRGTPIFQPVDMRHETELFYLAILGKRSGQIEVAQNRGCRTFLFFPPQESARCGKIDRPSAPSPIEKIPSGGGMAVIHSEEKIPEALASDLIPDILEQNAQNEAEKLLEMLRYAVEKKGHCKNLTLFVLKSPPKS